MRRAKKLFSDKFGGGRPPRGTAGVPGAQGTRPGPLHEDSQGGVFRRCGFRFRGLLDSFQRGGWRLEAQATLVTLCPGYPTRSAPREFHGSSAHVGDPVPRVLNPAPAGGSPPVPRPRGACHTWGTLRGHERSHFGQVHAAITRPPTTHFSNPGRPTTQRSLAYLSRHDAIPPLPPESLYTLGDAGKQTHPASLLPPTRASCDAWTGENLAARVIRLPSADPHNKTRLQLTGRRPSTKSYAKDLSPRMVKLQDVS